MNLTFFYYVFLYSYIRIDGSGGRGGESVTLGVGSDHCLSLAVEG